MKILGINKGENIFGKQLRDGGLALIDNGNIILTCMEERITQKLRAGGYINSLKFVENKLGYQLKEVDYIAVSTCTEIENEAKNGHLLSNHNNIHTINHHESHAWGSYVQSGFKKALIAVIDGGGNILSKNNPNWWEEKREQHSYFVAEKSGLQLIQRDFEEPFSVGFAELFRATSYYCGWESSRQAANVMALASYGMYSKVSKDKFIELKDGLLQIPTKYFPENPSKILECLIKNLDINTCRNRPNNQRYELSKSYWNLCAYIQWNVEEAMLEKLKYLQKLTKIHDLCITGGMGLNCVLNARIVESRIFKNIYIPPAPGDHGQALGNAMYLGFKLKSKNANPIINSSDSFLGPIDADKINSGKIATLLKNSLPFSYVYEYRNMFKLIATLLRENFIIATFQNRSEYGLRALGNRSIICSIYEEEISKVVASAKKREWFRPFAPSILEGFEKIVFNQNLKSPFMSFAYSVKRNKALIAPCKSNIDKARAQIADRNSFIGKILFELKQLNEEPICLNTSFNKKGYPIVENESDAISLFEEMPINTLSIGRFLVFKDLNPSLFESNFLEENPDFKITFRLDGQIISNKFSKTSEILPWIQNISKSLIFIRTDFALFDDYLEWLRSGVKTSTIRKRDGGVEWPAFNKLGIWSSNDKQRVPDYTKPPSETVKIKAIEYVRFGELDENDAKRDGFRSLNAMKKDFKERIYKGIKMVDWITLYHLEL